MCDPPPRCILVAPFNRVISIHSEKLFLSYIWLFKIVIMSDPAKMNENMTPEQEVQNDVSHEVSDLGNNSKDSPIKASSPLDVSKEDASKEDASKEDASKEDASKEDASKEDASKEDASKEDASKEDASKEDASKEDASKEDESKEDASKKDASKEDGSKEDWIDILGNGQLKKRVLRKGKQDHEPHRGDICVLNVTARLDDGTIVEDYTNISIQLGDLEIVQGLDLAIKLMKEDEIADIIVHPRFAYGTLGCGVVPPNTSVKYTVELKKINSQPEIEFLSIKQRKEIGNKKRERGNWWYLRKDFSYAADCYRRALQYLELDDNTKWNKCEQPVSDAELQDLLNDCIKVYNNLVAALIETEAYNPALTYVNKVLKYQPNNAKALYRKGKILKIYKRDYGKAYMYFEEALQAEPEEMKALETELTELKNKIEEEFKKERLLYAKMLGMDKDKLKEIERVSRDRYKIVFKKRVLWTLLGASAAIVGTVGILVHRFVS